VVSGSLIAKQILQAGLESGELELESLSQERFLAYQQGSFNHRHDGMSTRIDMARHTGAVTPPNVLAGTRVAIPESGSDRTQADAGT